MSVALGIERARPREEAPPPLTRQPLFVRFWIGQTISVFGDQISALAIPLTAILALDASALEVGILASLAWLPHLLFSLPAGVWIDRRAARRRNMIVADILRAASLATIPLAWWLGALTIWQLLAVAFAVGALTVFFDLSSASFFVALVHRSQYVDANSKFSTTRSLSYIAGPTTAGVLVQVLTAPGRDRCRRALVRRLGDRAARGQRGGAGSGAERVERAAGSPGGLPLPGAGKGAAGRGRMHEHDQLLQLLHLRDLRALREPHARARRRCDRAHPGRGLVRSARRRPDRAAGGAEARDRPCSRRRLDPLPGSDGALPTGARLALAERFDAARRRVPRERRRDDLRRQSEQPDGDADPAGRSQPRGRRREVLQLRDQAVRGAARRCARHGDRPAARRCGSRLSAASSGRSS